ncbi:SMC family ATPase [Weissella hellenica]|nr:SMC family ATPase [Weissella hellenica]
MRPLKLQLNNFGPYDETTIDFMKFTESKLFLITGDTGAGKTTIFDGMTYALFGKGTGERSPEDMRSEFANGLAKTMVTFWFEHNGHFYEIRRTPTQQLKKKRGAKSDDDTTTHQATASLIEVDETLETPLEALGDKAKIVNDQIEELLHLNADQFRKIILLPQDKFREFLSAQSDEKMVILRQLFGTTIFDDFVNNLKDQQKQSGQALEKLATQRDEKLQQVKWSQPDIEDVAPTATEKIQVLGQLNTDMTAEIEQQTEILSQAQTQLAALHGEQQKGRQIIDQLDQLEQKKTVLNEQYEQKDRIAQQKETLATLSWGVAQQPLVTQQRYLHNQYQQQISEKQKLSTALDELETQQQTLADAQTELKQQASVVETNQQLSKQIQENLLPKARQLVTLRDKGKNIADEIKMLYAQGEELEQTSQKLDAVITTQSDNLARYQKNAAYESELANRKYQFDQLINHQHAFEQNKKDAQTKKEQVTVLKQKVATAVQNQADKKQDLQDKASLRRDILIQQLQQELVDGEPCVICGQIYHAQAHHDHADAQSTYADLADAIQAVADSEKAEQTATVQLTKLQTDLENNQTQLMELTDKVTADNDTLEKEYATFKQDWQQLFISSSETFVTLPDVFDETRLTGCFEQAITFVKHAKNEAADLQARVTDSQNKLQNIQTQVITNEQKVVAKTDSKQAHDAEIKQIVASETTLKSVAEYETMLQKLQAEQQQYDDQVKKVHDQVLTNQQAQVEKQAQKTSLEEKITTTATDIETLEQQIVTAITDGPVDSQQAFDELLNVLQEQPDKINQLTQNITKYQTTVTQLQQDITNLEKVLGDVSRPNMAKIQAAIDQQQTLVNQLIEDNATKKSVLAQQKQIETTVKALQDKWEQQQVAGKDLLTLTQAVDGNNAKRLRLEPFILRRFLFDVLDYANHHYIGTLSGGRYQFILSDRQGGRSNQNGLDIDIYDQDGGKIRATSTLSGGESFISALSIALSMAEVVQRRAGGAKIDALFIDEGFGSLDERTLSQAMEALSLVEQSGRLVGIISHVTSMKQQIPQQLQVKKLGDGRSQLSLRTL